VTLLELKSLTTEQLDAVVELDRLCFGGLWTRSGYERELGSPNSRLLALEATSAPEASGSVVPSSEVLTQQAAKTSAKTVPAAPTLLVGFGCFWSILEEAHITIIAVHPDYRCQGLGQLLLYALLWEARQHQLERATLEVKPSNQAALSLYQKFGFKEAGRRRRYYKDTGEDALILWRGGLQSPECEEMLNRCYQQVKLRLEAWGWQLSRVLAGKTRSGKSPPSHR
jgi:ribosomal-protein-alanine N-acetyltransferase